MPILNRKVHMIQDIMNYSYNEEKNNDYIKLYNDKYIILVKNNTYIVKDICNKNIYLNLNIAHHNIFKSCT